MFPKRAKRSPHPPPTGDGEPVKTGPHPLEEQIERLERELAEQREAAKTLRDALDAATFKIEILEKSYAKQLAEVRDKRAALEAELKENDEILANLGGGHEHTLRELHDALTVIKVLKQERDQLRKQIAQRGFRQRSESKARALLGPDDMLSRGALLASDDDASVSTINALIANAGWADQRSAPGRGGATARAEEAQQPEQQEMLSPDLVFTANDGEKDDER